MLLLKKISQAWKNTTTLFYYLDQLKVITQLNTNIKITNISFVNNTKSFCVSHENIQLY